MRGDSMKGKSKKSTYSTTFGVDPKYGFVLWFFPAIKTYKANCHLQVKQPCRIPRRAHSGPKKYLRGKILPAGVEPASMVPETIALSIKLRELF